jgi:hypothetical protein
MTAIVFAIAGCSIGGPVTHPLMKETPLAILVPSPSSIASARIVESSDTVLQAHLLTLADLPSGWQHATAAGVSAAGDSGCPAISDPATRSLPLHAEADFTTSAGLPSLTEILAYGSTAQVDAAWTSYVQAIASCGHVTMRLAGQTLPLVLSQMPFPRIDAATDARQAVTTEGRKASVCLIVFRKGNLLVSVTYADWGTPSTSSIQRFVEAADSTTSEIR